MKTEFLTLIQTLESGETSVTFTNDAINTNSVIEIYTDNFEVYPDSVDVINHTLTINFDAYQNDVNVKIVINNIPNNGAIEIPTNVFELNGMLTPDPNYRYCPVLLDYDEDGNPILQKDYSGLIPRAISMLRDVALTSPSDGNILVYYDGYWYNKNNTIDELTNTEITTPTNDDVLTYDNGVWVNKPSQGGSTGDDYVADSTERLLNYKFMGKNVYRKHYLVGVDISSSKQNISSYIDNKEDIEQPIVALSTMVNNSSYGSYSTYIPIWKDQNGLMQAYSGYSQATRCEHLWIDYTKVGDN